MKAKLSTILIFIVGAVLGAVVSVLLQRTLPPAASTAEERAAKLEHELKKTRTQFDELNDASPRKRFGNSDREGVRSIARAMKEGRPVTPDDIFNAFKPAMCDLAPLSERMRVLEAQRTAESLAGNFARNYGFNETQQKQLIDLLVANSESHAKEMTKLIESDHSSMRDYMKAEREFDRDTGVDAFMSRQLSGETLQAYQAERMQIKSDRVQSDADLQVQRVDGIVKLDDAQRDQMFLYMAQTSRDYDAQMQFEGLQGGTKKLPPNTSRQDAMLSVLRPEQRQAYDTHKQKQLDDARQEAARLGLTIPNDWSPDDDVW
jgi:hypothetical protein